MADRFPRWRRSNRAIARAGSVLTGVWWIPVVTAVLSALGGSLVAAQSSVRATVVLDQGTRVIHVQESGPSWAKVFVGSLLVGVGAYVLLAFTLYAAHLWRYRRAGHIDEVWEAKALAFAGNASSFLLEKRPNTPPYTISDLGIMECRIKLPSGRIVTIDHADIINRGYWAQVMVEQQPPELGDYEVCWYGSKGMPKPGGQPRFYEITRGHAHNDGVDRSSG